MAGEHDGRSNRVFWVLVALMALGSAALAAAVAAP